MADPDDPSVPRDDAQRARRPHRPHLDPPLGGRIVRVERMRSTPGAAAGPSRKRDDVAPDAAAFSPDDGGLSDDAATLLELATAPVQRMARIVYSSNAAFVLELDAEDPSDSSRPMRAVYKPARGERPLWDFPHRTLHFREVATYLVSAALGLSLIPPTTLRDGPLGPGSAQLYIDVIDRELNDDEETELEPMLRDIAALDALVNNADRKRAHLLVTAGGALRGIDHGLTFLPYPRQRTVLIELGGEPLPESTAVRVQSLAHDPARLDTLQRHLRALLAPSEVDAFCGRLAELAADPVYPLLDPWDGRPFEWW
ncbi:MAG TPA: hypothetical protein VGQ42_12530 [Candidatus Dormibacteraeota bacterium]|jgi:hypothetical protein|nr:hypothetical protein [Candidatus Dormibacteraeota bacterium]